MAAPGSSVPRMIALRLALLGALVTGCSPYPDLGLPPDIDRGGDPALVPISTLRNAGAAPGRVTEATGPALEARAAALRARAEALRASALTADERARIRARMARLEAR